MNRLEGIFTTLSPLSHIGESISIATYLVQEPIIQPDGTSTEVFCYSGNAWRGQLRDMAAKYLLNVLDIHVPIDSFHLLFSGGKIGGSQVVNISEIKKIRESVPMIGLFGGGVGNSLMPGLMRVGNCYPLCTEATPALPEFLHNQCGVSYANLTFEKEFSRKADEKNPDLAKYHDDTESKNKTATQMRVSTELLVTGAKLRTYIHMLDDNDLYIGVLLSALTVFAETPFIGGMNNKGHGHVNLRYTLNGKDLCKVSDEGIKLSKEADKILNEYHQYIIDNKEMAVEVLG